MVFKKLRRSFRRRKERNAEPEEADEPVCGNEAEGAYEGNALSSELEQPPAEGAEEITSAELDQDKSFFEMNAQTCASTYCGFAFH